MYAMRQNRYHHLKTYEWAEPQRTSSIIEVRVDPGLKSKGETITPPSVRVNWAAIGSVDVAKAKEFLAALQAAVAIAEVCETTPPPPDEAE